MRLNIKKFRMILSMMLLQDNTFLNMAETSVLRLHKKTMRKETNMDDHLLF